MVTAWNLLVAHLHQICQTNSLFPGCKTRWSSNTFLQIHDGQEGSGPRKGFSTRSTPLSLLVLVGPCWSLFVLFKVVLLSWWDGKWEMQTAHNEESDRSGESGESRVWWCNKQCNITTLYHCTRYNITLHLHLQW